MEITLGDLAALLGGGLEGPADRVVKGMKGLEQAGPSDVSFLANPRYAKVLPQCRAGVVLVSREQQVPEGLAVIRVDDPYLAHAKLLAWASRVPYEPLGVNPRAVVDETAEIGAEVSLHALAYVGPGARLGDRVVLHPGAHVGAHAEIGDDTVLFPNVTVYHGCKIGKRCIIHAGTVIGSDGFGFAPDGEEYFKIPQIGIVQIDDDVEIGSNCSVDRAATGRTWIQRGVKIDNLVQVAHNCVVGENTILVAQVGVSGSTKLGRHVVLAGQVGVAGHITVGDYAQVAAKAGLAKSVEPNDQVGGIPAMPHRLWLRTSRLIQKLPDLFNRVKALEAGLAKDKDKE